MFSVGGTVLKEKDANAEDQAGLPDGAGGAEGVRKGFEHEERNREIFEDDGQLDSAGAQNTSDMMEVAGILAGGDFDNLSDEDLAKIRNPALRAQLQGKALEAKQAAELKAHQEKWDSQMHSIGGHEYSGAQLHSMHEYLKDDKNADAFEQELMSREGITREEAKRRRINAQEYLDILEKQRAGQKLTEEEERKKKALEAEPNHGKDLRTISEDVVAPERNAYGYTASTGRTGQQDGSLRQSYSSRADMAKTLCVEPPSSLRVKPPEDSNHADLSVPLIKADPLTPTFARAESSVIPLEGALEKRKHAQLALAATPSSVPQAEGATF
jgi:hypothetical protein